MMSGWVRLGILLNIIWLVCIIGFIAYEFTSRNVFCQFDAPGTFDYRCQYYFWAWMSNPEHGGSFYLRIWRIFAFTIGIPFAGWLFGSGIAWVVRGFLHKSN